MPISFQTYGVMVKNPGADNGSILSHSKNWDGIIRPAVLVPGPMRRRNSSLCL